MMNIGKIIIIEDDLELLNNCVKVLSLQGFDTHAAPSATDFFNQLESHIFDVAIVDIGLPDQSGYEIVEYLRKSTSIGLIIMTGRNTIEDKIEGYESGADYFFIKPVDFRELTAAVKNILNRFKNISGQQDKRVDWHFHTKTRRLVTPDGTQITLTVKEQKFIEKIFQNKGNPVARRALLSHLDYHGIELYGNRALDALVIRLRKKIKEFTRRSSPIKTERGFGYSFCQSPSDK